MKVKCTCVECGREWDDEFDLDDKYIINLALFCSQKCYDKYKKRRDKT